MKYRRYKHPHSAQMTSGYMMQCREDTQGMWTLSKYFVCYFSDCEDA